MSVSKICLINPPTTDPRDKMGLYFPMALLTLGGVLKKIGIKAELWDFECYFKRTRNTTENQFRKMIQAGVKGAKTNIFGISSICSNLPMAIWIAKTIKECNKEAFILFGGPQPSSIPVQLLERFPFIDAVVIGEGEITLEELVHANFDNRYFSTISGLAYRKGDKIHVTGKRPLVENMDDLPFPDYELIDFDDYRTVQPEAFRPNVEVGRGCPFRCIFCSTSLMWERSFRTKSPKRIFEEMSLLHTKHRFTDFTFTHDNFTVSKKFISDFCQYMEENNKNGFTWSCSSRTDCIDIPLLEKMFSNGLRGLFIGIESGSERMQKIIKKNLRLDHFEPVIVWANQLGLNVTTAFILGFPQEAVADIDQSISLALHYQALGTQRTFFSKLSALTGTTLYQEHLHELREFSKPSTVSPLHYGLPYIANLIRAHPDLFSSYYHVPHPLLSLDYLFRLIEFVHLLITCKLRIALQIMENLHIPPTRFFSLWDSWAEEKGTPHSNYWKLSEDEFRKVFQLFLNEVIFKSPKPYRPPALQGLHDHFLDLSTDSL